MTAQVLDDMTRPGVLTYVESEHAHRLQAERNILAAAHQWAVLHHPDRYAALSAEARSRAVPAGAPGTPPVTEYAEAAWVDAEVAECADGRLRGPGSKRSWRARSPPRPPSWPRPAKRPPRGTGSSG